MESGQENKPKTMDLSPKNSSKTSKTCPSYSPGIIGLIFFVVGLMILLLGQKFVKRGYSSLSLARKSSNWLSVEGVIVESRVEERKNRGKLTYHPVIRFEYFVDSRKYFGNTVYFGQRPYYHKQKALSFIKDYPEDSKVTVYYSPSNPSVSVLDRDNQRAASSTFYFGIGVVTVSVLVIVVGMAIGMIGLKKNKSKNNVS